MSPSQPSQQLPPVQYVGSVKKVRGDGQTCVFEFTDKYSIFDWGQMPDDLQDKGECLALMADFFFHQLSDQAAWKSFASTAQLSKSLATSKAFKEILKHGVFHHSEGLVDQEMTLLESGTPTRYLKVRPLTVLRPLSTAEGFDYSNYQEKVTDCLVPLEVIFRFGLPKGSSLLKRINNDPDYAQELGLDEGVEAGHVFQTPVVEFTSKLEPRDRYLTQAKAFEMAGLSTEEGQQLKDLTTLVALRLKNSFEKVGILLWDGKLEFGFRSIEKQRTFQLVDSIGPDELRLTYKGVQLSKEVLRQFYEESAWKQAVEMAKDYAEKRGVKQWKGLCDLSPAALTLKQKTLAEDMYRLLVNSLYQSGIYQVERNLDQLIKDLEETV